MAADDDRLAHELAAEAGRRLLALRAGDRRRPRDPGGLRDAGDRLSHEFLVAALARHRPADRVLSEEGVDDPARLVADRVWIVDPLDGTREFGEPGRVDWAVHVALWERDTAGACGDRPVGRLTAGAVALPAQGRVLSTVNPPRGTPTGRVAVPLRVAVSRTRPPLFLPPLAALMGAELVPIGSAGAKVAAVLLGAVDAYVHAGGQHEWDSAAPVAVACAAGLHASRIDGRPLVYNQPNPVIPDILVCRPSLTEPLLAAIRSSRSPDAAAAGAGGSASPVLP